MATLQDEPKPPGEANATSELASPWEGTVPKPRKRSWFPSFAASPTSWILADRFDRLLPPQKRYLGRSRQTFVIALPVLLFVLIGLAIGLSVGLTRKTRHHTSLPLPTGTARHTGDLTYYSPGLGACGLTSKEEDYVVSVAHSTFDAVQQGTDPNSNPLCKRKIRAQRLFNGEMASVDLTVVDRCTGCHPTDLDVSPSAFSKLANFPEGRVVVTWVWLN